MNLTAILAYADGRDVWIGGDSLSMDGWSKVVTSERKVWRKGDMLIGGSGVLSVVQKLKRTVMMPRQADDEETLDFLTGPVVDAFRYALKVADMSMFNEECNTALLIGYRGAVYHVTPSFGITPVAGGIVGMGAGSDLAVGAFEALLTSDCDGSPSWSISPHIIEALRIAAKHNATVSEPFYVEHLSVTETENV